MSAMDVDEGSTTLESLPLAAASIESLERHQRLLAEVERMSRARQIAVPTNDDQVKRQLRAVGEPICLFGEGPGERRERLRKLMAERDIKLEHTALFREEKREARKEVIHTEGSAELKAARTAIAGFSLNKAKARLTTARESPAPFTEMERGSLQRRLNAVQSQSSQIGDDRPVGACAFAPDGQMLATGGWSGLVKIWRVPSCEQKMVLRGHNDRVSGIAWHPDADKNGDDAVKLATGSAEGLVHLWTLNKDTPTATLSGHLDRVSRVAYHPTGQFLGTTSFDMSWRLWDVPTCTELLLQDGHTRATYALAFHPDGSLIATGGLDAIGRLWDLRSGRCVLVLEGHVRSILGMDFSPNGFTLASGSDDHTCRIWDLRKRKSTYTIPAHSKLISHVKFQPEIGRFLVTASYDHTCKIWSSHDWSPIASLKGHEDKVMCVDISRDSKYFATSAYDRTWKLFSE